MLIGTSVKQAGAMNQPVVMNQPVDATNQAEPNASGTSSNTTLFKAVASGAVCFTSIACALWCRNQSQLCIEQMQAQQNANAQEKIQLKKKYGDLTALQKKQFLCNIGMTAATISSLISGGYCVKQAWNIVFQEKQATQTPQTPNSQPNPTPQTPNPQPNQTPQQPQVQPNQTPQTPQTPPTPNPQPNPTPPQGIVPQPIIPQQPGQLDADTFLARMLTSQLPFLVDNRPGHELQQKLITQTQGRVFSEENLQDEVFLMGLLIETSECSETPAQPTAPVYIQPATQAHQEEQQPQEGYVRPGDGAYLANLSTGLHRTWDSYDYEQESEPFQEPLPQETIPVQPLLEDEHSVEIEVETTPEEDQPEPATVSEQPSEPSEAVRKLRIEMTELNRLRREREDQKRLAEQAHTTPPAPLTPTDSNPLLLLLQPSNSDND